MALRLAAAILFASIVTGSARSTTISLQAAGLESHLRLAFLGDYGLEGGNVRSVSALIRAAKPDFVFTLGDNNYTDGTSALIDRNIGQYFASFIDPYRGSFGPGARGNRFFPAMGNHDWDSASGQPYLDYFTLPGNERYYQVDLGAVAVFVLDSDPREPAGVSPTSEQGIWLETSLKASRACWNIVTMHHPPYSSGPHGSSPWMQWPFREWGAQLVLAGHDHDYERIEVDGLTYAVAGLGGYSRYDFQAPLTASKARFNAEFGALFLDVYQNQINGFFSTAAGLTVDSFVLDRSCGIQLFLPQVGGTTP